MKFTNSSDEKKMSIRHKRCDFAGCYGCYTIFSEPYIWIRIRVESRNLWLFSGSLGAAEEWKPLNHIAYKKTNENFYPLKYDTGTHISSPFFVSLIMVRRIPNKVSLTANFSNVFKLRGKKCGSNRSLPTPPQKGFSSGLSMQVH